MRWHDRLLVGGLLTLLAFGMLAMISASATVNPVLRWRHAIWLAIGLAAYGAASLANYRRWLHLAVVAYVLSVGCLTLVPVLGATRLGATRWLSVFGFSVQPSEIAKLATVWLLAQYLAGRPRPLPSRAFWVSLVLAGAPAGLVFLQPDLGSATVFMAIWLGMVWVAGVPGRLLGGLAALGLACLPLVWHVLKDYQRDRLLVFINPHADPLGAGYTIIQSTIAIGSGRLWGKGWFAGTQNQLSFLPERHSDFIFSVIGEEWGFVGCAAVVAAFVVILARVLRIGLRAPEPQGRLLAIGMASWIGYQAVINMGMVMGLLPVVGVPLPFLSYGGSSMVVLLLGLGLVQSVQRTD